MPSQHWNLLAKPPFNILDHLEKIDDAIDTNADIAEECLQSALEQFGFPPWDRTDGGLPSWSGQSNPTDQGKAYSTIKQLFRDWSTEGAPERLAAYGPVLQALETEFGLSDKSKIKILIPGAGLGRLLFEVCKAGFVGEGNEISYHQIIVSNHILNHVERARHFTLYPWVLGFSNHLSRVDQLQKVSVPDIHPASALHEASNGVSAEDPRHAFNRMSMSSGDFCVSYKDDTNEDRFDAVTTVFFIDTAPNLITYMETVHHCLKENGVWINLGPLLWHFENNAPDKPDKVDLTNESPPDYQCVPEKQIQGIGEAGSIELTEEEVVELLGHHGFRVEEHTSSTGEAGYVQNPRSMLQSLYKPSFWIARKISRS